MLHCPCKKAVMWSCKMSYKGKGGRKMLCKLHILSLFPNCLINSIIHEHSCKKLYLVLWAKKSFMGRLIFLDLINSKKW